MLVEAYNLGTLGIEAFFEALKALVAEMEEEEPESLRPRRRMSLKRGGSDSEGSARQEATKRASR